MPARLIEALSLAGLPDGAASLCFGEGDVLFEQADQVLWSGAGYGGAPSWIHNESDGERVKHWHHGGSKAVLLERIGQRTSADLAALAMEGCGRLSTKLSALLVAGDAAEAGAALATALARWTIAPLDDAEAMVPAFPDRALARRVDAIMTAAEARGAVDLTAEITGAPRFVEIDGALFLRPTVLLVHRGDPLLGAALPFPFVTVAAVPREEMVQACRGSLAVTLLGEDEGLRRTLCKDPTIDRVHCGTWLSGGDRVNDPHEGRLADFLFRSGAARGRAAQGFLGRRGG